LDGKGDGSYDEEDGGGVEDDVIFDAGTGAPISLAQLWMDQQMGPDQSEMQMQMQMQIQAVAPQTPAAVSLRRAPGIAEGSPLDDLDLMQGYELSPCEGVDF